MPDLDPATLARWDASPIRDLRIAASMYRFIRARPRRQPVASTITIAADLGIAADTVYTAKVILASHGILAKGPGQRWWPVP